MHAVKREKLETQVHSSHDTRGLNTSDESTMNTRDSIFKAVQHGSPEYTETVALRDEVLRRPLGLEFSPELLGAEATDFHLAGYSQDGDLLGCLILTPVDSSTIQMRQVAVNPSLQRSGIGTALVDYSESFARQHGYSLMIMHAREQAVPFYERLGYHTYGDRFEEVTIPHWNMKKHLGQ